MIRFLRAADHVRMPWKNGGGVTTEVAVYPVGASLETLGWRISMAQVASDGPFSQFAGIDRTLALLEGDGMRLDIAGRAPVTLTTASAPLSFPADVATSATLTGGPISDLNVMTRRGAFTHRVERVRGSQTIAAEATTLFLCTAGKSHVGSQSLSLHDAVILPPGQSFGLTLEAGSEGYIVRLDAVR
jgi:uncharacterized protein